MIWVQFVVLLAAILIGSRMKGIGLGVMGMVGMLIFILVFHMQPGALYPRPPPPWWASCAIQGSNW